MTVRPRRAVERSVAIDAPVEAVWEALTDPEELVRWFPLAAEVEPGPDGRVRRRWTEETIEERVETWEPGRRLRTRGIASHWAGIVTDYFLEGRRGGTMLRVVSAGFGDGTDWDDLLDAFGHGWDFELRGLKHYLERHRGRSRLVARASVVFSGTITDAWNRVVGPAGWLDLAGLVGESGPYRARTASGDGLTGTIERWSPPRQMVATVDDLNDALLRIVIHGTPGSAAAVLWLSTYGVPNDRVQAIAARWQESLARALDPAR